MYLNKRFKIVELFDLVHNRNSLMLLANFYDLEFARATTVVTPVTDNLEYRSIIVKDEREFVFHPLRFMSKHLILKKDIGIDHFWRNAGLGRVSLDTDISSADHSISISVECDIDESYTPEGFSLEQIAKLTESLGLIFLKQIELGNFEEDDFD